MKHSFTISVTGNVIAKCVVVNHIGNTPKPKNPRKLSKSGHRYIQWKERTKRWECLINCKYIGSSKDLEKVIEIRDNYLLNERE